MSATVEEIADSVQDLNVQEFDSDDAGADVHASDKVASRAERKSRKALQGIGLKKVGGITRVTMRRPRGHLYVIAQPEVYKSSHSDVYIVFGEAKAEDMSQLAQAQAAQQMAQAEAQERLLAESLQTSQAGGAAEAKAEEEEEDDDSPIDQKREERMEGNRVVVVSALQFACTDDVPTNLNTAERLVRDAHRKGANIILIQELFEGYYFCQAQREDFFQRAKPYKGHPTILRMQKLAKELGVVIPVSFFEEANNAHYNSIAIVDADGTDLGIYRKSHIPDGPGYQEKFYFNPGDTGFKVFETKFAKIGVAICWDQWFPEAARAMVLQGAEILLYPTAIGSEPQDTGLDSRDHWKRVMQGHAGANLVPLVASNRIGKEIIQTEHGNTEITFYGNSFIAGPTGEIVAAADDKEEAVVVAQFDLDKIKSKRYSWGIFRDRRPDLYKVLLTLDGSKP